MEEENKLVGETYLNFFLEKQLDVDLYFELQLLRFIEESVNLDLHLKSMFEL